MGCLRSKKWQSNGNLLSNGSIVDVDSDADMTLIEEAAAMG